MLSEGAHQISVLHRECNWMQGWEGEMDTVHAAFLHGGASKLEKTTPGTGAYYTAKQRSAKFSIIDTDFGTSYGAYRPAEEDSYYWRLAHMLFPFYAMPPLGPLGANALVGMYVPMDDENHLHWEIMITPGARARRCRAWMAAQTARQRAAVLSPRRAAARRCLTAPAGSTASTSSRTPAMTT